MPPGAMDAVVNDLVEHLRQIYSTLGPTDRYLVGISGAPGSGKTTIAAQVVSKLNQLSHRTFQEDIAVMLPMDGFHFYRAQLDKFPDPAEAHARRGAPHTFDALKYVQLAKSLKEESTVTIRAPSFDHRVKDPVENDIPINPSHRIVLIEGNYIQLTIPPWDEATRLLDEKWFITVERDVARGRVITRHLVAGIAKTEEEAGKRFDENDWPNGEFLLQNSNIENADKKIHSVQDPHLSET